MIAERSFSENPASDHVTSVEQTEANQTEYGKPHRGYASRVPPINFCWSFRFSFPSKVIRKAKTAQFLADAVWVFH